MPDDNIVTTRTKVYGEVPGSRQYDDLTLPAGTELLRRRTSGVYYRHIAYLFGKYSPRGLVRFPEQTVMYAVGIDALTAPTAALNGAGILSAIHIYYIEARHKIDGVIVHRSNLSSGSAPITTDGNDQVRVTMTTTIPSPDDERVTHKGIYRSDDGDLPREVGEVDVATATFDDNVASDARGATPPTTSNGLSVANRRGVPPYLRWVEKWHRRLVGGGNDDFPHRIYYSEVNEFESFGETNYVEHLDGEPGSGIKKADDQLLIFCYTCTYELTGYRQADFVLRKVHTSLGCISHFGIVAYSDNEREKLVFPSQRGFALFDGGFKFIFEDMEREWKADLERNPDAYYDMTGSEDWEEHILRFLLNTPKTIIGSEVLTDSEGVETESPIDVLVNSHYYIGHYLRWHPSFIGGPPQMMWTRNLRARKDTVVGYLADDTGRRVSYTMGCDGYIRRENVALDDSDDGDLWRKRFRLKTGHQFPRGPGGDELDGASLERLWLYLQAEEDEVMLRVWTGDEMAAEPNEEDVQPPAHYSNTFAPGAALGIGGLDLVPEVVKDANPQVAGRGHTQEILVYSPRGLRYSGWGALYSKGGTNRGDQTPLAEVIG